MRCPKCGYISFDHLKECRKCSKNIETISAGLFGSTYNIQAPTFLQLDRQAREESSQDLARAEERYFDTDDEYIDDELAVLVEDEDADEEEIAINFAEDEPATMASADDDEQDDGEIEIDFSQFEEADEKVDLHQADAAPQKKKQNNVKIDVPPALSDISDLARPAYLSDEKVTAGGSVDPDFPELNLDDLDFDLELDGLDGFNDAAKKSPVSAEKNILSLEELDFADALADGGPAPAKKTEDMDLDLDLDFELDLGGLSIHKEV